MRIRLCKMLVAATFFLISLQAFAWNNIGHMSVAYVAWRNLKPATRTQVSELIALNPKFAAWSALIPETVTGEQRRMYLFMIAATWADQIKGDAKNFPCNGLENTDTPPADEAASLNVGYSDPCMHKYWHFVDVSFDPDGTSPHAVPTPNVEVKIDALAAGLRSAETKDLKSYDLVWLEHLVGDIHQPLHCVTRYTVEHKDGDAGGNKVLIDTKEKELHAYWDDILGDRTASLYADARLAELVGKGMPAPSLALAGDAKTADWVAESVSDAEAVVYDNPPIGKEWGPYTLSTGYHANAVTVGQERVALAGFRLANLIRGALASPRR